MQREKYWTKERVLSINTEELTKTEFLRNYRGAYSAAKKGGFFDEIEFMHAGNIFKRCIYAIEFSDNSVYIGLTCCLERRIREHFNRDNKKSSANEYYIKTGYEYKVKQISDYIDVRDAIKEESSAVEKYQNNKWNILNQTKTGGVGSNQRKWNKEKVLKLARRYKNYTDFIKNEGNTAYAHALRHKFTSEIKYNGNISPIKCWSKELVLATALKYKNRAEFIRCGNKGAYLHASRNRYIKELKYTNKEES